MVLQPSFDSTSSSPLYQQLAAYLGRLISSGDLNPGDRLPATRELAGQLGINRTTVSAAYELLEERGFLSGQVGRGSFVAGLPGTRGVDWNRFIPPLTTQTFHSVSASISFAASRPQQELFPVDQFRASCAELLARDGLAGILQLGSSAGYEPLRQYLIEQSRLEGVFGDGDELLITNGCQQALDLIARTVVRPGMRVAVEDPIYPGLRNVLVEAGADLVALPVGAQGIAPEQLKNSDAALAAFTPSFQNPTGATWPLERREAVLRLARQQGIGLIEIDIYSDLRYQGEPASCLKKLAPESGAILIRSFSKIAFPGLRLGWVIAPRMLLNALRDRKQLTDLHSDQFSQAVMLRFAESGRLAEHRDRMIAAGRQRLHAALESAEQYFPTGTRWTRPEGGLNFWVTLPEGMDAGLLLERAQRAGVAYLPGSVFAARSGHASALRLSFGGLEPARIREGIAILGTIFEGERKTRQRLDQEPAPAMV